MLEDVIDDPSFLKNIGNEQLYWRFYMAGPFKVCGRIVGYWWNSEGIPITLMVQPDEEEIIELPWVSIQLIKQGKAR